MNTIKLDKQNVEDMIALTPMQEGMLFHYLSDPDSEQYFEQFSLNLSGSIDAETVKKSWDHVIQDNELLRTIYRWDKLEKPMQIILKTHDMPIKCYDFSKTDDIKRQQLVDRVRLKDRKNKMDIQTEPFRVILCKLSKDEYEMIISNHHIIYDGWSNGIILKEFLNAYKDISQGRTPERKSKNKFREYIKWIQKQDKKRQEEYWGEYLSGFDTKTMLPKNNRISDHVEDMQRYTFLLSEDITQKIKSRAKEHRITLAALLYSAWGILLQRYNDVEDVVFGTTVSGRTARVSGIEDMVGLFINTLPFRINANSNDNIQIILKKADQMLGEREEFESTPLIEINEYSEINSKENLFDSIVVIENYPIDKEMNKAENNIKINSYTMFEATNYDLTLGIVALDNIELNFVYNKGTFALEAIQRMAKHYENIIKEILENPEKKLKDICVLTEQEKRRLLYEFNDIKAEYLKNKTIYELFEEQAERTPDNVAVVYEDKRLTYRELNERANQLARFLREKGVAADSIVGIMVEKSLEMIVGIMGILKAGGAYLPIDPDYPKDRIEYMLSDSGTSILLTQKCLRESIWFAGKIIELDDERIYDRDGSNLQIAIEPENLAYVIYTSGTTGRPKGVMIEHRNIINTILWRSKEYKLAEDDKVLQLFSFAFDGFITSFFTPIVSGASVVLMRSGEEKDPVSIKECILENRITHFIAVPTLFLAILDCLNDNIPLHTVTLAGERITDNIIQYSKRKIGRVKIYNEYGPTENSVLTTISKDIDIDKPITIGKPIANTRVYIVDKHNNLQPVGIAGELCISGAGLGRGYINRPELTEEKFIENPFEPSERMYKTGDLARWLSDGNIEFLGRADHQVKIRGFRIELGEIEAKLLSHEAVKEAVVIAGKDESGSKYLCAYIVGEKNVTITELREHLSKELPDYMIPSYFVQLEKLPLTSNGKIDRKALPKPEGSIESGAEYEASRNEREEKLAKIWSDVLGVERIGINDNFFELGGHSLKATSLSAKIHKELNVELPLKQIFSTPTIKGISQYIKGLEENIYAAIERVEEREYNSASSAQKRLYTLQQFDTESTSYNMPGILEVEGKLDKGKLEESFRRLIKRHESLRTSFEVIGEEIVQKIHEEVAFEINYKEAELGNELSAEAIEGMIKEFIKPFDLNKAPLLRVGLIKVHPKRHILMFDMHHIISDGISMGILTKGFVKAYEEDELPELRIQYKDYAAWRNELFKTGEIKKQEEYWIDNLKGEIPVLNMMTDYPRPSIQSFEGDRISFEIDRETTKELNKLCKETGTTMYMVLLSAYNILLSKYSGQEDIIVGSPIAGRPHADLENIIGMFVNTLAIRNYPEGNKTFKELLGEVKTNALKAYENQDYQFEELVEKLDLRRDLSRNPLFDTMLVMQNMDMGELEIKGLSFRPYEYENKVTKFDLTLTAVEKEERIRMHIEYSTRLYKKETIERLERHYKNIIKEIIESPDKKLKEIELLSEEDKKQLLIEFNDTKAEYPKNKTIHELFEEQVERTPDNIAVVFEERKLTYRELNERANSLARLLREKGVGRDSIVGLMVEKSFEMIIGIMAILKSGGAYLPIDPDYPKDRIEYMLFDSGTSILLTRKRLTDRVEFSGEMIDLEDESIYMADSSNLQYINKPKDLAYIIYTSGTTGKPKGVMLEHRNVVRLVFNDKMLFDFNERDTWTMFHSVCFDFSVWEMYGALLYGGKLVVVGKLTAQSPKEYLKLLKEEKVTVLNQTPTAFYNLTAEELKCENKELDLRYVIFGGEALKPGMFRDWKEKYPKTKLINMYGITETTVHVTFKEITNNDIDKNISNIGRPIPTLTTYVMNKNMKLQPIGVPGELCVGGLGVGRGYLNRPELTAEKFIENPYDHNERLYRSGDLVRLLPDGEMEYMGRIDHQVKIRGFRIEIGEIENWLLKYKHIKEAVVLAREDESGSKYLCAYIVGERDVTITELREHLSKELPDYMIPSYFMQLEKLPLTPNGKIDRKALPKPQGNIASGVEYEAPRNETEEKLVKIWSEVLGAERIGINDNFFELGGHSLKATSLSAKIHKELNVELPLKQIFSTPTIKGISEYIKGLEENIYTGMEKVRKKEYYTASSAQKRLYTLQQFDTERTAYNMPGILEVEGELDKERLEEGFRKLIKRHESLRTSFEVVGEAIVQKVHEEVEFEIAYKEVRYDNELSAENIEEIIKEFIKPFDLKKAPLLRVGLIKVHPQRHILMFDMHHIISDGISMGILTKEFVKSYEGLEISELKIQYKDYAAWQNKMLNSDRIKRQEGYWQEEFKGEIPVLNLPADYTRPSIQSFEGDRLYFEIGEELTDGLRKVAKETGTTMYMLLLASFKVLLSKYSGQEDIIVGSPIAGRPHADLENVIGMFVNTLAIRTFPECSKSFRTYLEEVRVKCLSSYENQDYQFEELVEKLSIRRDLSRNPLFDVMFILQNTDIEDISIRGLKFNQYAGKNNISKFDITMEAVERNNTIAFTVEYCTKLFNRDTVERLAKHYENILIGITENLETKIQEIELLSEEEKKQLLIDFNDTKAEYPKEKTIHELFEEQVERTPDNIAAVYEDSKLTYKELNERANSLARALREKGVAADSIVGIMVERSLEMIVGIMGILKAGGAYLPIDPDYPKDRIEYMLSNSGTSILLTQKRLIDRVEFSGELIDLEDESIYMTDNSNLQYINRPKDLAYIIYTSGTTGKPKGVMLEHQNVVRLMFNDKMLFDFSERDTWTMFHSVCFDFSVWEMYGALLYGGKLVVVGKLTAQSPKEYLKLLKEEKVTVLNQTPTAFYNLTAEELKCENKEFYLRYVIFGGEALKPGMLRDWKEKYPNTKLINMYGITETTVHVTFKEITNNDIDKNISNIGRPIPTLTTYVMDKNMKLQPIGVPGELCVGGLGVGRGYLNRPELTAEKFIENPYDHNERLYRSGDLVRLLPDGEMEYMGRIDHQVKIRGFRIEIGEIENWLLKYKPIKEVVVLAREDESGSKYLCAYIVGERDVTITELREHLSKELPDYMIPSYFMQLEKLPLTPNGKIDRKALPKPQGNIASGVEYEAPRNETEEKLVKIWSEVLGAERIGINDNFFELGGHSLKATSLSAKIHKELSVEVPLKQIFSTPTIKGISEYIKGLEENIYAAINKVEEREYYSTSSAQKRLYTLQQFDTKSTSYNMPGILEVEGRLDKARLEESFRRLIKRHESLRTSFEVIGEEIVQKIHEEVAFEINYKEAELGNELSAEAIEGIIKEFIKPFDLKKAPLLRVGLIKVHSKRHILMFDMHHIISDGISMGILTKEFVKAYEGEELSELRIQYKDYAAWQNELSKNGEIKKQEEYWMDNLKGEIPVLNIMTDYPRPSIQSFEGDRISFEIDRETTKELNKLCKDTGTTMYMVLLSAYNILLSKYSGQEDIIVGSPIAGRPHADLENIIGMFVNTLAMRNYPEGEKTFKELLGEVKTNALKAYENQDYQFEELVEKLDLRRDLSRNPLFDTMLVMQNMNMGELEISGLNFRPYEYENKATKFDLTLTAIEKEERIRMHIEYSTRLYKRETIERLERHYKNIIKEIIESPDKKLKEIELLSEEEKRQLLIEFNDTKAEYPKEKTIHELFEEQAERTPDNIAAVYEDSKLTYKELNERANSLARALREKGVAADSIVGIMVERSLEMIVGIMGTLKAGGAYLPIGPDYPKDRIEYMLSDSGTSILLTQKQLIDRVEFNGELIDLEDESIYKVDNSNLEEAARPDSLAYVIYTSGSTGRPKGVMVEHENVINLVSGLYEVIYKKYNRCNVSLVSPYVFDASVKQIFPSILLGHTLFIIPEHIRFDGKGLLEYYHRNLIDIADGTPIHISILLNTAAQIKNDAKVGHFVIGGEALPTKTVVEFYNKFNGSTSYLTNVYGPTECCDVSASYTLCAAESSSSDIVPIGRPLSNVKIYILNKYLEAAAIGVAGELYIGGAGVARGYLNKPRLTAERFIDNPFEPGERIYKTGDLARWLPDGNLEFLGRADHQVKIRGFRIELGEIESQLLNYNNVKEAVAMAIEDESGDKSICAYITGEEDPTAADLRQYLSDKLPEYMIPSYFVKLEKLPLTPNGKIDRKLLPKPDASINISIEYEAPRDELEEKLVKIWSDVLGIHKLGINDNFFELGGHSLKATSLIAKMCKEINAEIPLRILFITPTVKGILEYIKSTKPDAYTLIQPAGEREYYPVSSAQKRLFILNQINKNDISYNMPIINIIEGKLDKKRFENAFKAIASRHESLTTSFGYRNGDIVQFINKDFELIVDYREAEEHYATNIAREFIKPFALGSGPLFRLGLIKISEQKHMLLFDIHHIISDGISLGILIKEFIDLYEGRELLKLRIQYKDYAVWQNELYRSGAIKRQEEYWLNKLKHFVYTELPKKNAASYEESAKLSSILSLDDSEVRKIDAYCKHRRITKFVFMLAVFKIIMFYETNQSDISIGIPISGRKHYGLEGLIGLFLNVLVIRSNIRSSMSFREYLEAVEESVIEAQDNQDYPYEELYDKLGGRQLFSVLFNYMPYQADRELCLQDIAIKPYNAEKLEAKYDITVYAKELKSELQISILYRNDLYKEHVIHRILGNFITIIKKVLSSENVLVGDIDLVDNSSMNEDTLDFDESFDNEEFLIR